MEIDIFDTNSYPESKITTILPAIQDQIQNKNTNDNANPFAQLGVQDPLVNCLAAHNIKSPTIIQEMSFQKAFNSENLAIIAPTSSGKTLCFLLPIVQYIQQNPMYFQAVILTPTRELAYQINEQFMLYTAVFGLYSSLIIGGESQLSQNLLFDQGCYILVCTPGRLAQVLQSREKSVVQKRFKNLKFLVLDEVDQFTGGASFNRDIQIILDFLPEKSIRQTILTTASMTDELRVLLSNSRFKTIQDTQIVPKNLKFQYLLVPQNFYINTYCLFLIEMITGVELNKDPSKITLQQQYANKHSTQSTEHQALNNNQQIKNPQFNQLLVFTNTVERCEVINRLLLSFHFSSVCLHSALTMQQRIQNINYFKCQAAKILVTTDVCARGLDIPSVSYVINTGMPALIEDFQHRAGRCARRGNDGVVITLVEKEDFLRLQKAEEQLQIKIWPLEQLKNFATQDQYIIDDEKVVRNYFGKICKEEKEIKMKMMDQDVGLRIHNKTKVRKQDIE